MRISGGVNLEPIIIITGKFEWNFRHVIFKQILVIDGWGISCEIALIWMSLDITDDQSTLVQVMAWCCQATSHYLSQCWPRSLSPYGVTRPHWVKDYSFVILIQCNFFLLWQDSWVSWHMQKFATIWGAMNKITTNKFSFKFELWVQYIYCECNGPQKAALELYFTLKNDLSTIMLT